MLSKTKYESLLVSDSWLHKPLLLLCMPFFEQQMKYNLLSHK